MTPTDVPDVDLPPLPGPAYGWSFDYYDGWHYDEQPKDRYNELNLFTEDQMQAYARQAVLAERERCATIADQKASKWDAECLQATAEDLFGRADCFGSRRDGARTVAAAIRGEKNG